MRRVLFWGLLPLVLPQALWVRKNAPRFAAATGPRQGTVGSGKEHRLIAIGDSIIAGVGTTALSKALVGQTAAYLAEFLDGLVRWEAFGRIGVDARGITDKLVPRLSAAPADFFLVSVGVNDVTSLVRVAVWRKNLADLLTALTRHSPGAVIAVAGVPPLGKFPLLPRPLRWLLGMRSKTFDQVARAEISRHRNVVYVSLEADLTPAKFSPDGYHPSPESCREFGEVMAHHLVGGMCA